MATQRCPKCGSQRIRQGYRPTPKLMKLIFRYHLLCDQCNWEFTGFAIPGTINKKTKKKKTPENTQASSNEIMEIKRDITSEILLTGNTIQKTTNTNDEESKDDSSNKKNKVRRKVKVKLF